MSDTEPVVIHGVQELRAQAQRAAEASAANIETMGGRARSYLAAAGIALTLSSGLIATVGKLGGVIQSAETAALVVAVLLFVFIAVLVLLADRPAPLATFDLDHLHAQVDMGAYSEDEIDYVISWMYRLLRDERLERERVIRRLLGGIMLGFVSEVAFLASALIIAVATV